MFKADSMGGPLPGPAVLTAEEPRGDVPRRCCGTRTCWYTVSGSMVFVTGFGLKETLRGGLDERADSGDGGLERRGVSSDMDVSAMTGEWSESMLNGG